MIKDPAILGVTVVGFTVGSFDGLRDGCRRDGARVGCRRDGARVGCRRDGARVGCRRGGARVGLIEGFEGVHLAVIADSNP